MSSPINKAESRTKWHQGNYLRARNTAFYFTPILSELAETNSNHLWAYSLLKSCLLINVEIFSLIIIFFSTTFADIQLREKIGSSCLNTEVLSLYLI